VIAGFPIASAAIASYPSPGGINPGTVSCPDDEAVFYVFGSDMMDETLGLVFGEVTSSGQVSCDGGDSAEGYASGQSTTTGRVSGGDEKVG
jgi:hypothetical protein